MGRKTLKKFFLFNLYGFIYLFITPLVGIGMYYINLEIANFFNTNTIILGILNLVVCMIYGYFYAFEVFRSYKERYATYSFIKEKLYQNAFTKKSILWSLKQKPCGDLVVKELEKEFGNKLWV
jgi:hypothetical protein